MIKFQSCTSTPRAVKFIHTQIYYVAVVSIVSVCANPLRLSAVVASLAPQAFRQEVAEHFGPSEGLPADPIQLLDRLPDGRVQILSESKWYSLQAGKWALVAGSLSRSSTNFSYLEPDGSVVEVATPQMDVIQLLRVGSDKFVVSSSGIMQVTQGSSRSVAWDSANRIHQLAVSPSGKIVVASDQGLLESDSNGWRPLLPADDVGRVWAGTAFLGVAFDSAGNLWTATRAGAGIRTEKGWRFFEGKDGLPWNDFTGIAAGPNGEVWFGTKLGAVRYSREQWSYWQGRRWLLDDRLTQVAVDQEGTAWFATPKGVSALRRQPMTLAEKATFFESEIERYVKRTPFGFVAEAALTRPGERSSANPQDSDNDGLWTAMYGAGQCFAFAATQKPEFQERARKAFEALRFLQVVSQGGSPAPPRGYVARTIRPVDWPDPNQGRLAADQEEQKRDRLWKAYEPRWPKSADGKWFWKSDTSSDELDGHYFFYPLYFEFCAQTQEEKSRVREVVAALTDHLIEHDFLLIDHDGTHTRWGVFGPSYLNHSPDWWVERGLNSLSILSYLAVAEYVTGDAKYGRESRRLIDDHGYAQNAMHPKVQHGPGSGNQSDDEMAFMCFYTLLRYSKDEALKSLIRISFYRYWLNEAPELNPFFNFSYAAMNLSAQGQSPWGDFPLAPLPSWHNDAMLSLYGFPLDRLNWGHRNSHRLDLQRLPLVNSVDILTPDREEGRGSLVAGKVLPVHNRHFGHWNTDPWRLDYNGNGEELAAGTVFLLPYYQGLYHGFISKP